MMMFAPAQDGLRAIVRSVTAAVSMARSSSVKPVSRQNSVRRDLAVLNDRTLADIGLSRTVSLHVARPSRHLHAAH